MKRSPTILIIDDVSDNVEVLGEAIAGLGEVRFALSGAEGLRRIEEQHPDLILLDVMMPGMNGYEVFAALKTSDATAHIPVIFVTAKSDPLNETSALNAGAMDFISKPINPTVAKARVRMHLAHLERAREVQQLNAELEQRVRERTQALSDALSKSRAAQEAKAQLLANMSHEFRTPLNAVLGMAYLASRKVADPAVTTMLSRISDSGNRLLGLLTGILDLASIETHKLGIEKIPFDLPAVVQARVDLLRSRALTKGLKIDTDVEQALAATVLGDPVRIGNVLNNFLDNAIKFSSAGPIQVRLSAQDRALNHFRLRMEVQDCGIGILQEDQAQIFDLFEQMDTSSTRQYGGAGIGLTICKQLVSLMDGSIGVSSTLGKGSTFWALIPLEMAPPPADTGTTVQSPGVPELLKHLGALLAKKDYMALDLWESERSLIEQALGPHAQGFRQAMDDFDLQRGLEKLREGTRLP